jgi:hypothetical protein
MGDLIIKPAADPVHAAAKLVHRRFPGVEKRFDLAAAAAIFVISHS